MNISQSAVLPFRVVEGRVEILVITTSDGEQWGIPKGHIEPELTALESAEKEAMEEAGIAGDCSSEPLGQFFYERSENHYAVDVFLMSVTSIMAEWDEQDIRERKWCSTDEARQLVWSDGVRTMISDLDKHNGWVV